MATLITISRLPWSVLIRRTLAVFLSKQFMEQQAIDSAIRFHLVFPRVRRRPHQKISMLRTTLNDYYPGNAAVYP